MEPLRVSFGREFRRAARPGKSLPRPPMSHASPSSLGGPLWGPGWGRSGIGVLVRGDCGVQLGGVGLGFSATHLRRCQVRPRAVPGVHYGGWCGEEAASGSWFAGTVVCRLGGFDRNWCQSPFLRPGCVRNIPELRRGFIMGAGVGKMRHWGPGSRGLCVAPPPSLNKPVLRTGGEAMRPLNGSGAHKLRTKAGAGRGVAGRTVLEFFAVVDPAGLRRRILQVK
jgi:hypothetical protein